MQKVIYFKDYNTYELNKMLEKGWSLEALIPARINERYFTGDCASYAILKKDEEVIPTDVTK